MPRPPRNGTVVIVKVQTPAGGGDECLIYDQTRKVANTQAPICGPLRALVEQAVETHGERNAYGSGKVFYQAKANNRRVHLLSPVEWREW